MIHPVFYSAQALEVRMIISIPVYTNNNTDSEDNSNDNTNDK